KTFSTPSPRSVLCPGDKVFIANFGKASISVFSIKDDWKQIDQLKVDQPKVVYLSSPIGKYFKDQLLATCDSDTEHESDRATYLIDTTHDTCRRVMGGVVGISSYDGRLVLARDVSEEVKAYRWDEFVGSEPQSLGGPVHSEFAYSPGPGSFWISTDNLL